jgi:hypothetical protein
MSEGKVTRPPRYVYVVFSAFSGRMLHSATTLSEARDICEEPEMIIRRYTLTPYRKTLHWIGVRKPTR